MNDQMRAKLSDYLQSARDFAEGRAAGPAFRERFMAAFAADQFLYGEPYAQALMSFFDEVECYEPDPALLSELKQRDAALYLDEGELRDKARGFVESMSALLSTA